MSQVPHELIRQVQISTRAAAGLPDYDPSDPTLPSLPPLSTAIAASDPSLSHLRCNNCKGMLLRGTESIICLYCGLGPHYDAVPEPICFSSTIGCQWLLRSLRVDGSEMIDLSDKREGDLGQSSPKSLTRLSEYLNFKIPWPTETEKQETTSDKQSEESKKSLRLTGVAPDKFFLKPKKNALFDDMPIEQSSDQNQIGRKDVAAFGKQDLFQNVQLSEPDLFRNEPTVISSQHKNSEALSGWAADFQSADTEIQHGGYKSPEPVAGPSADAEIKFQDHSSSDLEVDLGAQIDSVFGPGENLNDGKPKESPAVSPPLDDWNSDDMWNNLSSKEPSFTSAFDSTFSTKNVPQNGSTLEYLKDDSTTDDLFQDFQFQTNIDFIGSTFSTKNDPQNDSALEYSKDDSTTDDLFQDFQFEINNIDMTNSKSMNEEHGTMDEDLFDDWNDFTGSTSAQVPPENAWPGVNDQVSTSDEKSAERDLFSFDNKFEGGDDFGSFSQPNFFSTSTGNSNASMSENPSSNWLSETISPALESGQAANNEGDFGQSTKDDVKMLISQMHDLSFMLETDLSIPSVSDAPNPSSKD